MCPAVNMEQKQNNSLALMHWGDGLMSGVHPSIHLFVCQLEGSCLVGCERRTRWVAPWLHQFFPTLRRADAAPTYSARRLNPWLAPSVFVAS